MKKLISLLLVIILMLGLCACSKPTSDSSSVITEIQTQTIIIGDENAVTSIESSVSNSEPNQSAVEDDVSQSDTSSTASDIDINIKDNTSSVSSEQQENKNVSEQPSVTLCAQVANNIYIIGGVCSKNTEYITVGGEGVIDVKTTPAKGNENSYFTTQVKISYNTTIEIQGKEAGKDLSKKVKKYVTTKTGMNNKMLETDYKPVFGLDSRIHFYSAILTYTKSNFLTNSEKEYARQNISDTVSAAKSVGAQVIYLVVPSSAAVYPETVPTEYKAASGETLYKAFKDIAEQNGATVLYPLDTMKAHKNDGDGYKIYSHTDSHWTTYGAYWGVNALMSHISGNYPSAAPRTVQEMGFYVTELYGGDALFSFNDGAGFENFSQANTTNGKTKITSINELTTLYSLKMPTNTLSEITRGKKSIYLTKDNAAAKTETNSNVAGLPTAVIARDSFGRTAYDMINDRFSKVTWLDENDYGSTVSAIYENHPNYVIYIVSERDLLKVMMNNDIWLTKYFN